MNLNKNIENHGLANGESLSQLAPCGLHPWKLAWNLKMPTWKRKNIFQTSIFGFLVGFPGCSPLQNLHKTIEASNSHNPMVFPPCHSSSARLCWYLAEHRPNHFQFCSLYLPKGWRLGSRIPEKKSGEDTYSLPKGLAWWLGVASKNGRTAIQTPDPLLFHWSKSWIPKLSGYQACQAKPLAENLKSYPDKKQHYTTASFVFTIHESKSLSKRAMSSSCAKERASHKCSNQEVGLMLAEIFCPWGVGLIHGTLRLTVHDRFY